MLLNYKSCFLVITLILWLTSCHSSRKTAQAPLQTADNSHKTISPKPKRHLKEESPAYTKRRPLKKKALKRKYATILNTSPGKIKNKRLYFFIDDWYGVKYKWGGNTHSGVDCSGLVCQLYKHVYGLNIKRTVATQHDETKNFKRKRRLKEGDLIYFKTEGNDLSHVGVYLKNGFFLHSSNSKGVAINSIYETYWDRVYAGGGKVKKKKEKG